MRDALAHLIRVAPTMLDVPQREEPLWTRQQTADFLSISLRHLDALTAEGELRAVRLGRAVRYRPADVRALATPPPSGRSGPSREEG